MSATFKTGNTGYLLENNHKYTYNMTVGEEAIISFTHERWLRTWFCTLFAIVPCVNNFTCVYKAKHEDRRLLTLIMTFVKNVLLLLLPRLRGSHYTRVLLRYTDGWISGFSGCLRCAHSINDRVHTLRLLARCWRVLAIKWLVSHIYFLLRLPCQI